MATRFEKYRMKDGLTPLSAAYFNLIWQDIDLRLAAVEEKKAAFEAAVTVLTDQGLLRINEALALPLQDAQDALEILRTEIGAVTTTLYEIMPDYFDVLAAELRAEVDARIAADAAAMAELETFVLSVL
jgi:hypothetical protein